jgi:hypothetical protein
VIVEMPPSENSWNKASLDKDEDSFRGERSLSGTTNSRFCGSASLKIARLQFFLARHRKPVCRTAASTALALRRRFDLDCRVLQAPMQMVSLESPILLNPESSRLLTQRLNLVQNQPVIMEMPPSETAGTKNLSKKTKLHLGRTFSLWHSKQSILQICKSKN